MPTSFTVGSIFELDAAQAESTLGRLGGLFEDIATQMKQITGSGESLFRGMAESMDVVGAAGGAMADVLVGAFGRIDQAAAASIRAIEAVAASIAAANRAAAGEAAAVSGGGGGRGSSILPVPGGRGGIGDDRRNADAMNLNADQIYRRQEAAARRENEAFDRRINDGPIGPPVRPLWGQGDDWANAHADDSNVNAVRDNERRMAEYENADRNQVAAAKRRRAAEPGFLSGLAGGPGMGGLVAGATGYMSEKAAMQEDLAIRNTLIEGLHITPEQDPKRFGEAMAHMRQIARDASRGTVFSESQAAVAMPVLARELGFTGDEGMGKFSQIFRPALQAAEVAQQTGLGDLHSSLSASVEFAHMTGAYDPGELEKQLNVLRSVAQLTNQTMRGEETIQKYSVPIGMAAGMSPEAITIHTGFLQQQGFNSSTAGTGLSALILGALSTGGGLGAHLEEGRKSMEREFEADLKLSPKDAQAAHGGGGKGSAHLKALEDLNITKGGKLQTVDAQGNFDLPALITDIRNYATSGQHSKADVLRVLHDAFGTRGERIAAIYAQPDSGAKIQRFDDAVRTSPSASQIQGDLAQAPLNQFEQMLANVANIGNTLATATLPGLNTAFMTLNTGLVSLNDWLAKHETAAEVGGYGALGLAGVATLGIGAAIMRPIVGGLKWLFGSGGGGEAAAGGGEAGAGLGGIFVRGLGALASTLFLGSDTPGAGDQGRAAALAAGGAEWAAWQKAHPSVTGWLADQFSGGGAPLPGSVMPRGLGGGDPEHHTGTAPGPITVTVNVGGVSITGTGDDSTFHALVTRLTSALTDGLKGALEHGLGHMGGSRESPYVTSGAL